MKRFSKVLALCILLAVVLSVFGIFSAILFVGFIILISNKRNSLLMSVRYKSCSSFL